MADVKWIKIVTDIFDDEKILLIETMPEADNIIVIWFKMLCLAGKQNNEGVFMMSNRFPYTDKMLASIFRRDENIVKLALGTFEQFGMIEMINETITIPNWLKHQDFSKIKKNNEYMREYMKRRREKQKDIACENDVNLNVNLNVKDENINCKVNCKPNVNALDKSREDKSRIDKSSTTSEKSDEQQPEIKNKFLSVIENWNNLNVHKLTGIKNNREKMLNARIKEHGIENVLSAIKNISKSDFLQGKNNNGWTITFDWFLKPNNFVKVFEGNYDNKGNKNHSNTPDYSDTSRYDDTTMEV